MTPGRRDAYLRRWWPTKTRAALAIRLRLDEATVTYHARRLGLPRKAGGRVPAAVCGTDAEWQRGCRCGPCVQAHRDYQRDYEARQEPPTVRRALATRLNHNGKATGHGSLARAEMGCDCPRCAATLAKQTHPNGPPRWRCPCDAYRVNPGDVTTCPTCGTVPDWVTTCNRRRTG